MVFPLIPKFHFLKRQGFCYVRIILILISPAQLLISGPFWTAPTHQEYVVGLMDYFSKWPEYLLTGDTTSPRIIN